MEIRVPYGHSFLTTNIPDQIGVDISDEQEASITFHDVYSLQIEIVSALHDDEHQSSKVFY